MFFIGLGVDGQSGLFVESFQSAAGCFMVRSSGVYQGAETVNETVEVFKGASELRESERMVFRRIA